MIALSPHDALLATDIQNDFLPGGALGIRGADGIVPVLMTYMRRFEAHGLPLFVTRDWHPPNHCSFLSQGGPWPPHCVAGSPGSLPPPSFVVPPSAVVIYKAIDPDREAYSAFEGTALDRHLKALGVRRLFIGGLATDYCVLHTAEDATRLGYRVMLLVDAIRAVDASPGDGRRAEESMLKLGAEPVRLEALAA